MGAPELLHHLRGAGLVLTLATGGGLHVAPRTALTDDHRAAIRTERDALVLALQAEGAGEALPEPALVSLPADIVALVEDCIAADLYGDEDRETLTAMYASDPDGTRVLVAEMHARIGRCYGCQHFSRPGLSDGYCGGREDLPHAYGPGHPLRGLPVDGGATCTAFKGRT
jgi:hypothetical protein